MSVSGNGMEVHALPKHESRTTTTGSEIDFNSSSVPSTAETPLLSGKEVAVSTTSDKSCLSVSIANLTKNIIGAGTSDFAQLWTICFGKKSAWVVDLIMFLCTGCLCLGFSIIICDYLSEFNLRIGLPWWACTRLFVGIISLVPILPLAYSKSLHSLGWVSIVGLLATAYTFVYVVADTVEFTEEGGNADLGQPRSEISLMTVLEAVSLFATAYVCHYNAPKFNTELKNSTPKRFNQVSLVSFVVSGLVYAVFAWAGHVRFGDSVNGDVLTDYQGSTAGVGCMLMWLFMALCLICGYPVTYLSSQESLRRLGVHIPTWIYVCLLVLGGILIRNLSFFLALEGSLLGVTVGFTLPGMMFVILSYKTTWAKGKRSILLFSWSSIVIGIFCTVVGVVSTCITG
ncbi:10 transmembrane domain, possible aa transporter, putative [Perkinsus marinus ATCC 50983]|uniref:10 transmembrane domain, possible aa transporter, putative n=1 Tax=Perkinsus marinus (strain ATCC 50983 / TXsc) TaxID=423536 RepID=C5KHC4_PERM5|nr:10 transmembrane domain, possible aa transporter, putative [Perkinsus marinus ATCC 50983]EER15986.1 10 transmembrane domain, possible aa transporter, putative [Perkinsus marinus ATCC 50983]|eukprot:XP_002784190.1 10 transmembrane domain, possible aa transporter, putative [Perkinsus marinus ATCC 50983]